MVRSPVSRTSALSGGLVFWLGVALISLGALLLHLRFASSALESMDAVLFTRGLLHYDLLTQRPQWPGYPVYLLLGHSLTPLTGDPLTALRLLSVLSSTLFCLPLAALVKRAATRLGSSERAAYVSGWAAALLWVLSPLAQHSGTEVYSDPPALLLGGLALWSLLEACTPQGRRSSLLLYSLSGLLMALTLGVRLSYLPLLLAALPPLWVEVRAKRFAALLAFALPFALGCGAWLGWQLLEGGADYWTALRRHLKGHFDDWGGSVTTDSNRSSRPGFFGHTLWEYGLGAGWGSLERGVTTLGWIGLLALGVWRTLPRRPTLPRSSIFPGGWGVLTFGLGYTVWLYLGNDVQLERLYAPLVALLCGVAALGLSTLGPSSSGFTMRLWPLVLYPVLVVGLGAVSVPLTLERSRIPPPEVQLAAYAEREMPLTAQLTLSFNPSLLSTYTALPVVNLGRVPGDRTPLAQRALLQGKVPYSASYDPLENTQNWREVARFCPVPSLHSRESRDLVLYRYSSAPVQEGTPIELPCTPHTSASPPKGFVH